MSNQYGGYPTAYRKGSVLSGQSRNSRTRLQAKLDAMLKYGPYDLRPPPRVRPIDLRDTARVSPVIEGTARPVPYTPPVASDVGPMDRAPSWRARDRAKLGPPTIDLTPDQYRKVEQQASNRNFRAAFRTVYRAVRGLARNKDLRVEIALRALDAILANLGIFADEPTGRSKPEGWTFATYGTGAGLLMGTEGLTAEQIAATQRPNPGSSIGIITSRTNYNPRNAPPYPYEASISGQALNPNTTFQNTLGVWNRYEVVPGLAWRNQHLASWIRTGSPVTAITWQPQYAKAVQRGLSPFSAVTPSAKPGGFKPSGNNGGYKVPVADPPPAVLSKAKDRKFAIAFNNRTWYGGLVNATTEVVDLIDVFYKALGKKCKGANTPQAKVMCLYKNWDTLDWEKALRGLVANQIEDYIYGRIGSLSAKAARKIGASKGFQLGPWDTEFAYNTGGAGFRGNNPIDVFVKFTTGT